MTYFDWLRNKGCGCNNGCKDINPCSCDEILLEISNLHTDDQVLQNEIDDLSGKVETISGVVDTKLDASAYTPTDLTDYYTKEEVNDIADDKLDASAYTPTDLSNYYNKQEVNYIVESAITDVESEIPSLSGYATEQWVLDKHYITGVDLSDYYTKEEVDDIADTKLDVSAYTPTDLSNYYNKQEVNDIVVSSITEVESEIPSLSGYATEQWVDNKGYLTEHQPLKTINGNVISGTGNIVIEASGTSVTVDDHLDGTSINPVQNKVIVGALNNKLDVSAYTPTDLSNYYTKDEVNSAITEVESEIPSLSGYATEQWVESQGYLTDVDLSDYALTADTYTKTESDNKFQTKGNYITYSEFVQNIYNIQEQINSLISAISGCCGSSGETIYRWITLTGQDDYICSGTTKYTKEQQQQSTDNGITWSNVVPAQYRQGKIIETESTDCGYIPPTPAQYRWITMTGEDDYICNGFDEYSKQKKQVSTDGGQTWTDVSPEEYRQGNLIESDSVKCGYTPPIQASGDYLTFYALEDVAFLFNGRNGNTVQYSLDSGSTWATLSANTATPTITSGNTVLWKGELIPSTNVSTGGIGIFSSTGRFNLGGNPMSLLYGDNFRGQTSLSGKDYAFAHLFDGCSGLINAERLSLPATTLSTYCYSFMFHGCKNLTKVSEKLLPATALTEFCYQRMFRTCYSLTTVLELPALTLTRACYNGMFQGCDNLPQAPVLNARTLVTYCYDEMFNGCSKLNYIKCLATDISASACTNHWISGVSSNGTFVKSSSINTWHICNTSIYDGIPCNWTVQNA